MYVRTWRFLTVCSHLLILAHTHQLLSSRGRAIAHSHVFKRIQVTCFNGSCSGYAKNERKENALTEA